MIKLENISKSFGNHRVLDDINISLKDGEILSIIGQSGTGKSVLLKIIIGLIEADSGKIYLDQTDITRGSEEMYNKSVRPQMSMIFQEGALWDSMTVGQNIDLALRIQKHLQKEEREKRIRESLEFVGLPHLEDQYPGELSGGMAKRVAIARGIAIRPKYLLYDEPTTGLDPVLSNIINDLIIKLNTTYGITSLIISHDISAVEKISHRVAMLFKGKIVIICNSKDMYKQKNKIFNHFIQGRTDLI